MASSVPPTAPQVPKKPFQPGKWLLGGSAVFGVGYLALSLIMSHFPGTTVTKDKATAQQPNTPASQLDMDAFNRSRNQKLIEIAKKRALIQKEMQAAGLGDVEVLDIVNHLPACNKAERESLNGQTYVAVNQQTKQLVQFACETDDAWHPLPVGAGSIQQLTPQQQQQIGTQSRRSGGSGDGMSPKERAAQALDAALKSSAVVDFATPQAQPAIAPVSVAASNLPPGSPVAAGLEAKLVPVVERTDTTAGWDEKEKHAYAWDTYTGPLYRVFEGEIIEGILTNRIAGEFTGPVNVMVTTNLYSRDRLHILMPQGTRILGEFAKVSISGQRRLAVPFHRVVMPDGYSIDLEQSAGLDQQGATGLTGRVNTHWPKVIATAVLVGAIGGLSEIGASGTTVTGLTSLRLGVTQQTGQEATQILDRALNILPTVTIYEGTRVRIYLQRDLQLPAYENHTIPPSL